MIYKVGDVVRCVVPHTVTGLYLGTHYTVTYVSDDTFTLKVGILVNGLDQGYSWSRFELINEQKEVNMGTPRKHAELIIAWANGAQIQYRHLMKPGMWKDAPQPTWSLDFEYRIKPEPKPDIVRYVRVKLGLESYQQTEKQFLTDNAKFTFDGETGELKALELL